MKKPIKINTNRANLSSDEIKKHQNFKSTWQKQYLKPKPFYKNPKFFGGVIILTIVAVVIIIDIFEKRNINKESPLEIITPIKSLDIMPDTFSIEATKGDTLTYKSGTQLIIPDNCFVNENGDTVNGKIDIAYREFNSSLDLFLCGIPMAYDSAGVRHQFESAGMMEIQGYQNNKPVFIRKTKTIKVNMASSDNKSGVNLYRFDSTLKNWVMIGKDSLNDIVAEHAENEILSDKTTAPQIQQTQTFALNYINRKQDRKQTLKLKPVAPAALKANYENFMIDFNPEDFPELTDFENVKFQLLDSTIKINTNAVDAIWEAVTLEQLNSKYQISFYAQGNVLRYHVIPAFEGKDLKGAIAIFNKKMESYKKALSVKKDLEEKAQQQLLLSIQKSNAQVKISNEAYITKEAALNIARAKQIEIYSGDVSTNNQIDSEKVNASILAYNKRVEIITKVTRSFEINGFGIFNCDRIMSEQGYKPYAFEISMPDSAQSSATNAYLIYRSIKSVINNYYNQENKTPLKINIKNPLDCRIIIVVDEKTIAICKGENIKKAIDNKDYNLAFELQSIDKNKESLSEIFTF